MAVAAAFAMAGRSAQAQATTTNTLAVSSKGAPVTTVPSKSVVRLTATVTSGGMRVPAGTVNFCNAAAIHCTDIDLVGTAQLTTDGTASIGFVPGIGKHSYKAVFAGTKAVFAGGTTTYASSTSADEALTVTGTFPTTTAIAASGTAGDYTLTATVVGSISSSIGAIGPTGTVSFLDTTNANYPVATAMLGTGTLADSFAPQVAYNTSYGPASVAVGDFNGDGIPDLAVTNSVKGTVSVLLGKGDGTFGAQVEYGFGDDPVSVAVADFNGDGIPDLAVADKGENAVEVFFGTGDGTFRSPFTYFTGASPNSVAVGDFNGDGILDLVVTDSASGTVSVLLGIGGGGFSSRVDYTVGTGPASVAVGDFNGDGIPDLAVANDGDNTVSVLFGKGDGTFSAQVKYGTGTAPICVAVGDFNGDGILDLAVDNSGSNTVSVLLGKGDGTFSAQAMYGAGTNPVSLAVGDFNGDGIADLAEANNDTNTVSVLLGKGDGTFNAQVAYATGNGPQSVAVGDFNGDGVPDLAVANAVSNTASVLLNKLTETATVTATGVYLVGPGNPGHLVEANYPGVGDFSGSVSGKINLAAGPLIPTTLTLTTTSPTMVPVGTQVTVKATLNPYMAQGFTTDGELVNFLIAGPAPGEIDPEATPLSGGVATLSFSLSAPGEVTVSSYYKGMDDAFDASQANNIVFNVQNLTTTALAVTLAGVPVTTVASGTVVNLTATVTSGSMRVQAGTVNFCNAAAAHCTDINLVGTAQLNTDGTASISFVPGIGSHSYKAVFAGTSSYGTSASAASPLTVTGTFPTTTTISASGVAGDYTLRATVVGPVSSSKAKGPTGQVSFLNKSNASYALATAALGAGTVAQTFAAQVAYQVGKVPQSVAVGDFNGDGIPDLAVANGAFNTVSVLLGNANGTFQGQVTYGTGGYSVSVAVADFNGDGIPDLAVANLIDNTVSVLLGNGDGTFQSQVAYATGTEPASVAVGDFNRDGIIDLAVANYGSGTVSVLLGNGDGTFIAQVAYRTGGSEPMSVVVGDFNSDGIPDLAIANSGSNTVSVLLGIGDGSFNIRGAYGSRAGPASLAVGDFNGDGFLDLAVANNGAGTVSVLLGSGDGNFNFHAAYAAGTNPRSVAVGDFNGDGIPDLAVTNAGSNTVSVLLGKGGGTFNAQAAYATANGPQSVAVGDFNGDGVSDLAVANTGSNTASVLLNNLTKKAAATASGVAITGTGMQNVQASYPGNANYSTSVSTTTPLTAQPVATTLRLSTSPASINLGQSATLTARLSPYTSQGYTTNGGTVTFMSNGVTLGTAALQTGTATLITSALLGGANELAASFAGDSNFAPASGQISVYVNQPPVCTLSVNGTSTALTISATARCRDPQNQLFTATINWGDGTSAPLSGTALPGGTTLLHTYNSAATYTVIVTATNTFGLTGTARQQINPNQLPICSLGIILGTAATYAVSVTASCSDPQSQPLALTIDWGDSTVAPATNNAANTHTYSTASTYYVTLSGVDTSGLAGVSTPQLVNVLPQAAPIPPGGSASVSGTAPPPPQTVVGTLVTFICSSVSTTVNGQTVNNALPSEYGISCTSPTITLTTAATPINVTIQTTAATMAEYRPAETNRLICAVVFPLPGVSLLLLGTISPGRRRGGRRDQSLAIGMAAALCFGLTSCGGSFRPPPVKATPAGKYYVTVVETVVNPPAPTGFVQTSLIVPLPVTSSTGN